MIRILFLTVFLWMASGCRAREQSVLPQQQPSANQTVSIAPEPSTHRAVAAPPVVQGVNPILWVALEEHLGRTAADSPLNLRSAGGSLLLEDSAGGSWTGPDFSITWRSVPLKTP